MRSKTMERTKNFEVAKAKFLGIMASLFDRTVRDDEVDLLDRVLWEQENYLVEDFGVTSEEILDIEDLFWITPNSYTIIPV